MEDCVAAWDIPACLGCISSSFLSASAAITKASLVSLFLTPVAIASKQALGSCFPCSGTSAPGYPLDVLSRSGLYHCQNIQSVLNSLRII